MNKNNFTIIVGNVKSPCLDCQKRHVGCHDECKEYAKFLKDKAKNKKAELLSRYYQ